MGMRGVLRPPACLSPMGTATTKASAATKASPAAEPPTTKSAGTTADRRSEEKEGGECIPDSQCTCRDSGLSNIDVE